ncbi:MULTISPECIES: hypothetical protein [unclassified Pseudofrankia]|uniref:hypothetical protein n=1 Tax=unclassified Pseudofrankia TaxID=2994372 RepID=UPI0008D99F6F|nr:MULTISPECIES: hypothetical protein [unclassified Pseudofrankia]MDT3442554.1 hypothetical protein [Pseudofrankia sp. BMG5.37]OHV71787.1 hypothetical protein BCD48_34380 [Pseudofrankia sp. BMG5.36]
MIVRSHHRRRAVAAAAALASAALIAVASCSSDSSDSSDSADTAAATPTASGATSAGSVQAACEAELTVNATNFPGIDPDAPAPTADDLRAFAAAIEPAATALRANLPAELTGQADKLIAVVNGAKQGKPFDLDSSGLTEAGHAVDAWMYDHCGYPKLDVTNDAGTLTGVPASVTAGPVAIRFTNTGDPNRAGFILLVGKAKDGATATAADVAAGRTDFQQIADVVTVSQPVGDEPGYTITRIPAGHYILDSPLGTPPDFGAGQAIAELDAH